METSSKEGPDRCVDYAIIGGGIVGCLLALALHEMHSRAEDSSEARNCTQNASMKRCKIEIYDKVAAFLPVGAGMGLFANGNRVLRDVLPASVYARIRAQGRTFDFRQWEQHDGEQVIATASESVLCGGDDDIASLGISRWRLHQILIEAVHDLDIPIHYGKYLTSVVERPDGLVDSAFLDETSVTSRVLFGCDGNKSSVRTLMAPLSKLEYIGVTCLMGISPIQDSCDINISSGGGKNDGSACGITFPCSNTSKCHGVFFPTMSDEQCFQIFFPINAKQADPANWSVLSETVGAAECQALAETLCDDGWADKFVRPLQLARQAVRVGFCTLQPQLTEWTFGKYKNIVLVGDAAHPPVPYTGQGAQLGMEDVGVLTRLVQAVCFQPHNDRDFDMSHHWCKAMTMYQSTRIPRTAELLRLSLSFGQMQQKRAESESYDRAKQQLMRRDVFFHETLPGLLPGATYNYKDDVEKLLRSSEWKPWT